MEQRSIKVLKLMEAIQERQKQSQRQLAEVLDMSLGMVNKLINELGSQGFLESDNCGNGKVQYALTPKGAAWQTDLKKQYMLHQIDNYNEMKKVVGQGLTQLSGLPKKCRILFYGAGELCEIACTIIIENNHREIKIVDDKKAGKHICGIKICKEAEIDDMSYDAVVIMGLDTNDSIHRKLVAKGIPLKKIFTVFPQNQNSVFNKR